MCTTAHTAATHIHSLPGAESNRQASLSALPLYLSIPALMCISPAPLHRPKSPCTTASFVPTPTLCAPPAGCAGVPPKLLMGSGHDTCRLPRLHQPPVYFCLPNIKVLHLSTAGSTVQRHQPAAWGGLLGEWAPLHPTTQVSSPLSMQQVCLGIICMPHIACAVAAGAV